jgi:hypothetical protein
VQLATYHKPAYGPGLAKLLSMYSVHESKAWDTVETSGAVPPPRRAQRMRTNPAKFRNS